MKTADEYMNEKVLEKGDISDHLQTIKKYAEKCDHITELGVRWVVSTWALLAGKPKKLNSFDVIHYIYHGVPANVIDDVAERQGTEFNFYNENVLTTDKIEQTDLLFIDTLHSYKQLKMELALHGNKSRKFIIITNTATYGSLNEGPVSNDNLTREALHFYSKLQEKNGLMPAISEWLTENREWRIKEAFNNNNGLCILERIPVQSGNLQVTGNSMSTTFTGYEVPSKQEPAPEPIPEPAPEPAPEQKQVQVAAPVFLQERTNNNKSKANTALVIVCVLTTICAIAAAVYFAIK